MNWSELSPRERDALIAEKVMGREVRQADNPVGVFTISREYSEWYTVHDDGSRALLPYTTDISAAWEVVEKMTEEPKTAFRINKSYAGTIATYYPLTSAATEAELRASRVSEGIADTAPEAIALAALRAKGVEV